MVTMVAAALLVISLPYWLPPAVVALRVRIFAWVNGENSVAVPGRLVGVEHFLGHVIDETLRQYPLFGVAHRITSADIDVNDDTSLPAGSVLCFNYPSSSVPGSPITMATATREVLARFDLRTAARHTRSMPNRGPCLLVPRAAGLSRWRIAASLVYLRLRDRVEDVWRSLAQLGFGSYMVWDARRQGLCTGHFAAFSREPPHRAGSWP